MPNLMCRSPSLVERCCCSADGSKGGIIDGDPIILLRTSRCAGITENTIGKIAYPEVEIAIPVPGIIAARGRTLDGIVIGEALLIGLTAYNARGCLAVGIHIGQHKFKPGVCGQAPVIRRDLCSIGIQLTVIPVEHSDLGSHLLIADILSGIVIDDMYDDGDSDNIDSLLSSCIGTTAIDNGTAAFLLLVRKAFDLQKSSGQPGILPEN